MLINKELSNQILNDIGETRKTKAKRYINEGRVNIIKTDYEDLNNFSITSIVSGNYDDYKVNIKVQSGELIVSECECADYEQNLSVCKHIAATIMKFEQTKYWDNSNFEEKSINKKSNELKYKNFNNLINIFYNEEIEQNMNKAINKSFANDKLKIETKLTYDKFSSRFKARI